MTAFLPDVPADLIRAFLERSPGNEIKTGKFDSPESSSALVANAFGWFLERPGKLPALPGLSGWPARRVTLEAEMRFPWAGGRHPWLDVGIETAGQIIGIESKRYEPFRPAKVNSFSDAYDRPVWGERMVRYTSLRKTHANGAQRFDVLDAVQLVKHAYGLRTQAQKAGKTAVLVYLYAEPPTWANGRAVDPVRLAEHRADIARFGQAVAGDEVQFMALRWSDLLANWAEGPAALASHSARIEARFGPLG
ncbi:MAG: hypothetical protein U1D06_01030 [Paracoccaceae bacterium]|nr:hypothetical protein [Paracoccaceae bacterium]